MENNNEFFEKGDTHHCGGIMIVEGQCTCHISAPCLVCETNDLVCNKCGYEYEGQALSGGWVDGKSSVAKKEGFKPCQEQEIDDGKRYYVEAYFDTYPDGIMKKNLTKPEAKKYVDMLHMGNAMTGRGYKVTYEIKEEIEGLTAEEQLIKLANLGVAEAQYSLGRVYRYTYFGKCLKFYAMATKNGHSKARSELDAIMDSADEEWFAWFEKEYPIGKQFIDYLKELYIKPRRA